MESHRDPTETDSLCSSSLKSSSVWRTPKISLQEAYNKTGGFGRYQMFVLLVTCLSQVGSTLYLSNLVFFELKPESYTCRYKKDASDLIGNAEN